MYKRVGVVGTLTLASLALMGVWPVKAVDFRSNRTDGIQYRGQSINQQSSNQAYNLFDIVSDPSAASYGLYWKGALRADTLPYVDPREQDAVRAWDQWVTDLGVLSAVGQRSTYTPNIPQGWSPIVIDLDRTGALADHFLVNVSFEPSNGAVAPAADPREQVITAYWPETANGLGNLSSQTPPNRLEPLSDIINGNRIWRIKTRELAPIKNHPNFGNSVGVVTQPPIYSQIDGHHLLYLVIGRGENNDPAQVVCLRIPPPLGSGAAPQVPNPANYGNIWDPNIADDSTNPGGNGMVVWSYEVKARNGSGVTPVAGISFADLGDVGQPRPNLFLTTKDGQLICINARPIDKADVAQDGDPKGGEERWKWMTDPAASPAMEFSYGMAPAACRVPLTGAYRSGTLTNAISKHNVDEWMVFVADNWGAFRAFDASGKPDSATKPTAYTPRLRWLDAVWQLDPMTMNYVQLQRPSPVAGEFERFKVPPVVYQGGTPMTTSTGVPVGPLDVGYDDEVIFASERGRLYVFDAIGKLRVSSGADDGQPMLEVTNNPAIEPGVNMRWQWPEVDTAFDTSAATAAQEPRVWPRELEDRTVTTLTDHRRVFGNPIPVDTNFFLRSALSTSLGGNANPNGGTPNLDLGDDLIFVPYIQDVSAAELAARPLTHDATKRYFYEYVGSLKPYPFVQAERPIVNLISARITWTDPATMAVQTIYVGDDSNVGTANQIAIDRVLRVGTVKSNAVTVTQAPSAAGADANITAVQDDTAYFVSQSFYYPQTGQFVSIPFGPTYNTRVELTYQARDAMGNLQTYTDAAADLPSCYRRDTVAATYNRASNDIIVRSKASLSVNRGRLEGRLIQAGVVYDEFPAQVDLTAFNTYDQRQPSMFATGGANSSGLVFAPSWYRGRIIVFNNRLQGLTALPGFHDTRYGSGNVISPPFDGDPGPFVTLTDENLRDEFSYMDIGASVTEVDGWLYLTYDNGHTRAWSNQAGGAPGTDGPNTPIFTQPPSPNFGNRVRAPIAIRLVDPRGTDTVVDNQDILSNNFDYRDAVRTGDGALLLEYGEDIQILVDFGTPGAYVENSDSQRNANDPNTADPLTTGQFLDSRLVDPQNVVQAQLLSSIGAISQLSAPARGIPVTWDQGSGRCFALLTLNTGYPSGTNPLTPGTSVLREKQVGQFQANEALYYLQVTQSGVQWLWPHSDPIDPTGAPYTTGTPPAGVTIGQYPSYASEAARAANPTIYTNPDPRRIHYWTIEPNQSGVPDRFPRTAGGTAANPNWNWTRPETREYAPLVSYNNPLVVYYDPIPDNSGLGGAAGVQGMYDGSAPINALPLDPASISTVNPGPTGNDIRFRNTFNSVTDQGRKNGDAYTTNIVEGSRSGTGIPIIPTLGTGLVGSGTPQSKQLLFGEHGRTTPAASDLIPGMAQLRVGDRSHMGLRGRNLAIRVQRAPLTKMGMGAAFGGSTNPGYPAGAPLGSVQQNINVWDDGPDGLYPSIPEARLVVTKTGTTVDLASGSVAIPGRSPSNASGRTGVLPNVGQLESLTVQVDIPTFTPDDIYSTRWRTATQRGSAPNAVGTTVNGVAGSMFNPFWPGSAVLGLNPMSHWDRSEARATIAPGGTTMIQAPEPDPNPPAGHDPQQDDRLRRVIVFVDSDNDGKLDLDPNRREAYRTFAVQVGVQPDMKLETQTTVVDFGALHHGKKQPGMGSGAAEIREYQRMQQLANSTSGIDKSVATFYNQWWRKIVLVNRGNVNLAYVKPEILYTEANATSRIRALPSEGNDWFRALPLVNTTTASALADPLQIFIRTSFDDQFLPDNSLAYGGNDRGLWVQKAAVGSGLPGAIAYADNLIDSQSAPRGQALYRDPSLTANNWQNARDFWMTLNLPTGAPLGQYGGTMTFYNDRMVTFASNINSPVGYSYLEATVGRNGLLDRQVGGEPIEPMIDPPIQVKARVTETLVQGRYQYAPATPGNPTGTHIQDRPDRRIMPAASLAVDPGSGGTRLRLVYASNRAGITSTRPQPVMYDLWGTELVLNAGNGLFPFDELPDDRTPWSAWPGFTNPAAEFSLFSNMSSFLGQSPPAVGAITKPSLVHDLDGNGILAWSDRLSTLGSFALQGTNERHRVIYQGVQGNTFGPFVLNPGGVAPDMRIERNGVRMIPSPGSPADWFAFYDMGTGPRHGLGYTWTATPDNNNSWRPEHTIPTSRSFSGIRDPHAFMTEAGATGLADPLTWIAYAGATQRRGLTDIYMGRYLTNSLKAAGQKGVVDPQGKAMDYGLTSFPRVTQGLLQANPTRTVYSADGIDWLANPTNDIKIYLVRPDKTSGTGSAAAPLPLLGVPPNDSPSPTGERVAPLDPNLVNGAPMAVRTALQQVRVIADPSAGTIRFTIDTRMLARMLVPTPTMTADSPDPVILADYTPQTMRLTLGDISAHDPVVVPVLSDTVAGNVYDASWYLQHIDGTKWAQELPVAGIADRLWVFWRRTAGASAGSPSCYYKVLRPGIRVRAGAIGGIVDSGGNPTLNASVRPEEVNPQTGQLFYPAVREGQLIQVQYRTPQGVSITESHRVVWLDETGERPVPMDAAVNEGSLDAFAVYEVGQMTTFGQATPSAVRKMDRMWLFWSSTRGTGGDIYSATLAPRIGLEVAISGSATSFFPYASFSSATKSGRGRTPLTVNAALYNRRRPFVLPPIVRRGPLVPMRPRAARRAAGS